MGRKLLAPGLISAFLIFTISIGISEAQVGTATSGSIIRDAVKDRIQTAQDRRQELREELIAKKEQFKERLLTVRDEVKRKVVERIDTRITSVNQRVTNRFSAVLNKLSGILERLIGKAEDAKLQGNDTGDVDSAIGVAQAAIDSAKTAVASQAANLYAIEIASESAIKSDVGDTVSQLRADLKAVHKLIVDAKQAVQNVVMELAKLRGLKLGEENAATGSSQ